jgi:hypothetical protein
MGRPCRGADVGVLRVARVELLDECAAAGPGHLSFTDRLSVDLERCTRVSVPWKVPAA